MKTADSTIRPRHSRRGFATLIILILLTIMVMLAAANTVTLNRLRQREKMVEQRQTQRFDQSSKPKSTVAGAVTNSSPSK